jgi:hypothetical protein
MATSRDTDSSTPGMPDLSADGEIAFHPRYRQHAERDNEDAPETPVFCRAPEHPLGEVHPRDKAVPTNRADVPGAGDCVGMQMDVNDGATGISSEIPTRLLAYDISAPVRLSRETRPTYRLADDTMPCQAMPARTNGSKPSYRPDRFDGSTPWRDHIAHFESCARINGWDESTKCSYLAVGLKGPAQQIISDLGVEELTYGNLVKLLESRYGPGDRAEVHLAELRNRQRKPSESLQELGQAMRRLAGMA